MATASRWASRADLKRHRERAGVDNECSEQPEHEHRGDHRHFAPAEMEDGRSESDHRQTQSGHRSKPGKEVQGSRDGDTDGPGNLSYADEALKSRRNVTWKSSRFSLPIHAAAKSGNRVQQSMEQEEDAKNDLHDPGCGVQ
jgi:hypothetical protein